jgi:transcriptional regulator with XRE-family HTH domain
LSYFKQKYRSTGLVVTIQSLQDRLLRRLRQRVQNGEWSERRLARIAGVSQPHMHNVLKGVRILTPKVGDLLLEVLGLSITDLFEAQEVAELWLIPAQEHLHWFVVLDCAIGPGHPWLRPEPKPEDTSGAPPCELAVARLALDAAATDVTGDCRFALLDLSQEARESMHPGSYYAIRRGQGEARIRRLLADGDHFCFQGSTRPSDSVRVEQKEMAAMVYGRVLSISGGRRGTLPHRSEARPERFSAN